MSEETTTVLRNRKGEDQEVTTSQTIEFTNTVELQNDSLVDSIVESTEIKQETDYAQSVNPRPSDSRDSSISSADSYSSVITSSSNSSTSTGNSIPASETPGTPQTIENDEKKPLRPHHHHHHHVKKKRSKPFLHIAPLNTPLQHRLETIGIMWHCLSIPFFICLFLFTISVGWIVWLCILAPYFIWWYGFDLHTPTNGKAAYRVQNWMKNLIIWEWFVNYFPIRVHKTVDLEPTFTYIEENIEEEEIAKDDEQDLISENSRTAIDKVFKFLGLKKRLNDDDQHDNISPIGSNSKNSKKRIHKVSTGPRYIFGYHPHGVISMGVMGTFATNVLRNEPWSPPFRFLKPLFHDPSKGECLFSGIGNIFPLTLTTQFTIPFFRDYILSMGLTSASAKNIKSLISNGDNSICVVVGGAQESLLNHMVGKNTRVGYGFKKDLSDIEEVVTESFDDYDEDEDIGVDIVEKSEAENEEGVETITEDNEEVNEEVNVEVNEEVNGSTKDNEEVNGSNKDNEETKTETEDEHEKVIRFLNSADQVIRYDQEVEGVREFEVKEEPQIDEQVEKENKEDVGIKQESQVEEKNKEDIEVEQEIEQEIEQDIKHEIKQKIKQEVKEPVQDGTDISYGITDPASFLDPSSNIISKQGTLTLEEPQREVKLILNKRKGFVKIAIELGNVSLVPTFAFGEADVYHLTVPEPGSWGYKFQQLVKDAFQFTVPFFSARGVFIYDFGLLPYRNPINVCFGRPIYIPPNALQDYIKEHPEEQEEIMFDPGKKPKKSNSKNAILGKLFPKYPGSSARTKIPQKLLDHYHKLYVEELKRVFEDNKEKFGYGDVQLNIIE